MGCGRILVKGCVGLGGLLFPRHKSAGSPDRSTEAVLEQRKGREMNQIASPPPSEKEQKPRLSAIERQVWLLALSCFAPYRTATLLAGVAIIAGNLLQLVPPLLVRGLIDHGIPAGQASATAAPLLP